MYHLALHESRHTASRFNVDEAELRTMMEQWRSGQKIELGERVWDPHHTQLTVIEGPRLEVGELTMGRGWRTALRRGVDVTERLLTHAHTERGGPHVERPEQAGCDGQHAQAAPADAISTHQLALALQLGALLGPDALRLLEAWRGAAAREPAAAPSETLARAERDLRDADAAR
jgi:hypothetical protein